jgi:hypothetical protein
MAKEPSTSGQSFLRKTGGYAPATALAEDKRG